VEQVANWDQGKLGHSLPRKSELGKSPKARKKPRDPIWVEVKIETKCEIWDTGKILSKCTYKYLLT